MALKRTLLFSLVLLAAAPSAVRAQADAFQDARKVFGEAQKLYADGQYGPAADKYEAAYRLLRSPLMFFNIAQARRLQFQRGGSYTNLVDAVTYYERFIAEAEPKPGPKANAERNLLEVRNAATEEARKQFGEAEQFMRTGRFDQAIVGYEAAYALSKKAPILFNLAQAQRKQFTVDQKLDRLARAEDLILTYKRESKGQVSVETIEQILAEIREQRTAYHRKRDAEARNAEPPAMRDARTLYQQGDAAGALEALDRAEKVKNNPRIVLLQIYRLRGQAAAMADTGALAVESFKHYLALEPAADGTGLSDASVPHFEAAKAFWKGKTPLKLDHLPPGKVPPQQPVDIPVKVASDPLKMIHSRELLYRQQGFKKWTSLKLASAEPVAKLPKTPLPLVGKSYRMEYFVVARNRNDAVLDTLGNEKTPLAFLVTEDAIPKKPPVYKRWWFWAAAGAAVAGTVATIAIVKYDDLPDVAIVGDLSQGIRF